MTLTRIKSIEETPELVSAIANYSAKTENSVCAVCGLNVWGHGPESKWLGYDTHEFDPRMASAEDKVNARELTTAAYRARCAQELCGDYCRSTHDD